MSNQGFEIPATVSPTKDNLMEVTPANINRLRGQQKWLYNEEFQVNCTDEQLAEIRIRNSKNPRSPNW